MTFSAVQILLVFKFVTSTVKIFLFKVEVSIPSDYMLENITLVVALTNQRTRSHVHTFKFYNKISFFVCRNDIKFATLC